MSPFAAVLRRAIGVRQHHVDALDDEYQAGDQQQADDEAEQVGRDEVLPAVGPDLARMHGHETAETLRREQHDEHEDQALIEQPRAGEIRGDAGEEGHDDRAERRPEESARAADEGLQHDVGRGLRREDRVVGRLVGDGEQCAGDAGEQAEMAKISVRATCALKPRKRTRCSLSRKASASLPTGVLVNAHMHHADTTNQPSVR